jgi:hypothetical protein
VDPEVLTQFNCLQQTGNFCPSMSNAASPMSSSSLSPTTTTSNTASPATHSSTSSVLGTGASSGLTEKGVDAFFAFLAADDGELELTAA